MTDPASRDALVAALEERGLTVEVLVNNAGFGTAGHFTELDPDREVELVRTNVEPVVAFCGAYAQQMAERGRGAIMNVASMAAFQPLPIQATYAASKAFVLSFSEALSAELRPRGVTVTALCPGPVETEFTEQHEGFDVSSPDFVWMSSEDCASTAVKGLERGKRVVVPGVGNRIGTLAGQHAPRSVLLAAARRFYPPGR